MTLWTPAGTREAEAARVEAPEKQLPTIRVAAQRTTDELGGVKFRMSIDGVVHDKRSETA